MLKIFIFSLLFLFSSCCCLKSQDMDTKPVTNNPNIVPGNTVPGLPSSL